MISWWYLMNILRWKYKAFLITNQSTFRCTTTSRGTQCRRGFVYLWKQTWENSAFRSNPLSSLFGVEVQHIKNDLERDKIEWINKLLCQCVTVVYLLPVFRGFLRDEVFKHVAWESHVLLAKAPWGPFQTNAEMHWTMCGDSFMCQALMTIMTSAKKRR